MNSSNLIVWYENGCPEEVHLPDPSFWDVEGTNAYYAQREYLDWSDPDLGIFLERSFIPLLGDEPASSDEEGEDRWLVHKDRIRVVSPEDLSRALLVTCHGVDVLRRDPLATSECGLAPTAPEALGFGPADVAASAEFFAEGIEAAAKKLAEGGVDVRMTLEAVIERVEAEQAAAE